MEKKKIIACATVLLVGTTLAHANTLLYGYSFDSTLTTNSGSGTGSAVVQGTPTITAGGFSGSFAQFDGGDVAGSDAIDVDTSGDNLSLAAFEAEYYINLSGAQDPGFNSWFAMELDNGVGVRMESNGDKTKANVYTQPNNGVITPAVAPDISAGWHQLILTGTESGGDAEISLTIDGTSSGSFTFTGGAGRTIDAFRIGGSLVDNPNLRYIDSGIDEFRLTDTTPLPPVTVPIPTTNWLIIMALVSLGWLGYRRKSHG